MGYPTYDDLKSMNFSYSGEPFVWLPANQQIHSTTMDVAYQAEPFVVNDEAVINERSGGLIF